MLNTHDIAHEGESLNEVVLRLTREVGDLNRKFIQLEVVNFLLKNDLKEAHGTTKLLGEIIEAQHHGKIKYLQLEGNQLNVEFDICL